MKGFSALILVILVGALLAGASFLYRQNNVKGMSTSSAAEEAGFLVSIISKSETWDLSLYGCANEADCTRLSKTGGGATELKELKFAYAPDWAKYSWIRVSVQPGRPGARGSFEVLSVGDIPGSYEKDSAVFVPVDTVSERFFRSAVFSDR